MKTLSTVKEVIEHSGNKLVFLLELFKRASAPKC